jgi:hypothetical protein
MTPTIEQAWALARDLEKQFAARVVIRTDAPEYALIRAGIEAVTGGTVDVEKLLEGYSQTIGPLVYIAPRHAADPSLFMDVVVHEAEHVSQWHRDHLAMSWLYLTTQEGRASYEAKAYAAQLEWRHARHGTVPALDELTLSLEGPAYVLGQDEIRLARELLVQRATAASHGHYAGASALAAIAWAKKHAPDLLHHA